MSDNLITIKIDNQEFKYWTRIKFEMDIDTFDRFEFNAPFDPDKSILRDFFEPLTFKPVTIEIDNDLFLTGTLLNVVPSLSDSNTVICSGYSKPGILNDAYIPVENYPIEYNNQSLEQIAERIAGFFDIETRFTQLSGAPFDRVALDTGKKPLTFLIELAKKKGFLISNNQFGELLFRKAATKGAQTNLRDGHTPLLSINPVIDPQKYFSSVTGMMPGSLGAEFETITVKNPFISNIKRPYVYKENQDLDPADFETAVKWKAGLMFAASVNYEMEVQGLRNQFGLIWQPNTFLNVFAPSVMIYKEITLLIKSVELERSENERARLVAVLPESYTGEIPLTLPWLN